MAAITEMTIQEAPDAAMAFTFAAMADTIGIVMHSAATAERNMQTVENAAVTVACSRILAQGPPSG